MEGRKGMGVMSGMSTKELSTAHLAVAGVFEDGFLRLGL